jgi:hypothetical protein
MRDADALRFFLAIGEDVDDKAWGKFTGIHEVHLLP